MHMRGITTARWVRSMTEGKLYGIPNLIDASTVRDGYYVEEIVTLLDEAKKEFPADSHGLFVEKVMPWFWKYFGDES